MTTAIPLQVVEFLAADSCPNIFSEKIAAAQQAGKKSVIADSTLERAYLGNAAWLRYNEASGYVKGWCATLRMNECSWLGLTLREQIPHTELWKQYAQALANRNTAAPGVSPIELARSLIEDASERERAELTALTGLSHCHSEILAHLLTAPIIRNKNS